MDQRFQPISWLQSAGHEAYLVGNQVRSQLLGVSFDPKDIDIATSATPEVVAAVLRKHSVLPGKVDSNFGVVGFQLQGNDYEVTTFREDIYDPQFDHIRRAPAKVNFVDDLKIDSRRRDFTINAIYWDPTNNKYLDPQKGRSDLRDHNLRFVGEPELRIKEDPLRVLRAIRFKHSLNLKYDASTKKALQQLAPLVHKLSTAALKKEFHKIQNLPNYDKARRDMLSWGIINRT